MALPARGSATMAQMARGDASRNNAALAEKMEEMKGVLNRLLFKTETNTKESAEHLAAIKAQSKKQNKHLGDISAAAELMVDELGNLEAVRVDGEKEEKLISTKVDDEGEDKTLIALQDIRKNTKQTADAVKVLADEAKERKEQVLVPPKKGKPLTKTGKGEKGETDDDNKKEKDGIGKMLAAVIGGYIGIIGSFFAVWFKTLKFVFGKPLKAIGNFFKNLVPEKLKTGPIGKGFEKMKTFFSKLRSFFKPLVKIFTNIFKFMTPILGAAGRVMAVLNPIGLIIVGIMAAFETIKGFLEGFAEGGILGGLYGAVEGLIDFIVYAPLNLVKDIIAWIAGMLGFDGVKDKLNSFDFSFDGFVDMIFNFLTGIKDWVVNGLKDVGIPPFKFTIPFVGKEIEFDGWFPFKGIGGGATATGGGENSEAMDVDVGADLTEGEISKYKQEVAAQQEAGGEVMAVKLPADFAEPKLQGKKAVVTGTTFRGGYKMITEDGTKVRISPTLRKEVDSILEGGEEVGGELQQGDPGTADGINAATTAANQAADNVQSGGGSSMTSTNVVNSPTNSQQSTSIYYGDNDNSLGSRAAVVLPG